MSAPSFSEFRATVLSLPVYVVAIAYATFTVSADNPDWVNFAICILTFYVCVIFTLLIHATAEKEAAEDPHNE